MTDVDKQVYGEMAVGYLTRIHEQRLLGDTGIAREIAGFLGSPADTEFDRLEKLAHKLVKDGRYNTEGWNALARGIIVEGKRLRDISNAIGAGSAAGKAHDDLIALTKLVEESL